MDKDILLIIVSQLWHRIVFGSATENAPPVVQEAKSVIPDSLMRNEDYISLGKPHSCDITFQALIIAV